MALITRFTRLFRADLHAVMDRMEDPLVLLRQSIREMETALDSQERRRGVLVKEQDALKARWTDQDRRLEHIGESLDVCLEAGKDDLARPLLRERLGIERGRALMRRRLADLGQRISDLDGTLNRHRQGLAELRDKADLLVEPRVETGEGDQQWVSDREQVRDAEVEIELLRARQQRGLAANRPTLLEGCLVALVAALGGAVAIHTLGSLLPWSLALSLSAAVLALGYLIYLLGRTDTPVGRPTAVLVWLLVSALAWSLNPPLGLFVLVQAALIWLARSLYFHDGPLAALVDGCLVLVGLAAAQWAVARTGSPLIAVWCLFLIQGLFVLVPQRRTREPTGTQDGFEQAHRAAERALRALSTRESSGSAGSASLDRPYDG